MIKMNNRGFTLLELLVVIAILGLITSIAIAFLTESRNNARIAGGQQFNQTVQQSVGADQAMRWSFEAINGGEIIDTSGGGINGTVENFPGIINDPKMGNVGDFNGTNSRVYYSPGSLFYSGPFTVSVWVKTDDVGQNNNSGVFASRDTTTSGVGTHSFQISVSYTAGCNGKYRFVGSYPDGSLYEVCFNDMIADWQHLVVTYDGNDVTTFTDGQRTSSVTRNQDFFGQFNEFLVGVNRGQNQYFDGKIDEVNVYFESLELAQIQSLYAEGLERLKLAEK